MQYVLDAVVILIPVICIFLGYRRGFVRTILQLVGTVAAFVVAMTVSPMLATFTFDSFVSQPLTETIVTTLQESDTTSLEEQIDGALEQLPEALVEVLHADEAAQAALEQLKTQVDESAPAVAETLVTTVIRPLAVSLINFLLFIILFILLLIVVKLVLTLIKPVTKLPLVRQVDQTLGGVTGLLKGVVFALALVTVMQLFFAADLNQTVVALWLSQHNPVAGMLSL